MQKTKGEQVTVPRDRLDDPFYRYTMPVLCVKVQGRGKMIKTVILNLDRIAISLERPAEYILKFIGFECGARVDTKNDQFTVGGERKAEELAKILDIFVEKYILCSKCRNPETEMAVKKGEIVLSCRACGTQTHVDFDHKFTELIIKKGVDKNTKKKAPKSDDPSEVLRFFWEQKPSKQEILTKGEEIRADQGWTSDQMLRVVFGSLFEKDVLEGFENKAEIYTLFMSSPKSQETTLYCIEKLCTLSQSNIPIVATILEQFYNHQLLKAANIKHWFENLHPKIDKKLAQKIRDQAKPFVENLSVDYKE